MGTQSILIKNLESYQEEFNNKLLHIGDRFTLQKRFMIGDGVNPNQMKYVKIFHKLLCTENCELIDWINKKIQGKLEDCDIKVKKKPTISDLFKIYQQQVEACSLTEVTGECCDWETIEF